MESNDRENTFCLTVDFEKDIAVPHVLFQSIADMILEFQSVDRALTKCIDSEIEPIFVLDRVQKGSIKVWLRQVLKNIPDEALIDLDAKKILGAFLVKAKHRILQEMDDEEFYNEPIKVEAFCNQLQDMAMDTNILIPTAIPQIDAPKMLTSMSNISKIARKMPEKTKFTYSIGDEELDINKKFYVPIEKIEQMAERESVNSKNIMILKVKQPDYLGNSQWSFKHSNKKLLCGFEDCEWLDKFHSRKIDIRPGDSLRVEMDVRFGYDKNYEVISEKYTIIKVLEVITYKDNKQIEIQM